MNKEKTGKMTKIVLIVAIGCLLIYDAVIAAGKGTTISQIVWAVSMRSPLIPFLVGIVCGHLFWQK